KEASSKMLWLVYSVVACIAFISFRSLPAVICAMLPLWLTSLLCEALMVVLGLGIKVSTLPVIALGVGIGIDYALYVMSVTIARMKEGNSLASSYYSALISTGKI